MLMEVQYLELLIKGNMWKFLIRDDGVGMDEEKLGQILSSQSGKSRGIGLVNTDRRLTKLYGKGLEIHSSPEKGTTITFDVPKANQYI